MQSASGLLQFNRSESRLEEADAGECLSEQIADGVLPLATALGYATDVAAALRELHGEGRAHGEVGPDHVRVRSQRAVLLPSRPSSRQADPRSDIVAFGALLYELLTGSKPPRDLSNAMAAPVPRAGPEGVRRAAQHLALRCLAAVDPALHMQQALMEVRLYSLMARQSDCQPATAQAPAAGNPSSPLALGGGPLEMAPGEPGAGSAGQEPSSGVPPEAEPQAVVATPPEKIAPSPAIGSPPGGIKCPACGTFSVRRSHPRTVFEHLLSGARMRFYRCHRCDHRYVSALGMAIPKAGPYY